MSQGGKRFILLHGLVFLPHPGTIRVHKDCRDNKSCLTVNIIK